MKIKTWLLGLAVAAILIGGVLASQALGLWRTTNGGTGQGQGQGQGQKQDSGQTGTQAIRGSSTFGDISGTYGIPLEDLAAAFGVSQAEAASFQCKELEPVYGELPGGAEIGVGSVRYFAALYKGDPIAEGLATWLPRTAVDILKAKATLSHGQLDTLEQNTVDVP